MLPPNWIFRGSMDCPGSIEFGEDIGSRAADLNGDFLAADVLQFTRTVRTAKPQNPALYEFHRSLRFTSLFYVM